VDAPSVFGAKTIKSVVNYGLNDMPGFPDLTDHLLDNLLLYLGNPASAPEPIPSRNEPPPATAGGGSQPVRYWSGYGLQPSIIRPPWTVMTAYDLNRGVIKWQVPLGNAPQGKAENLKDTGIMMSRNGPVVTATSLVFIATKDEGKLRAYDEESGKVLWETDLPAASERRPSSLRGGWARVHRSLCSLGEADGHTKGRARAATCAAGPQILHRICIA
jgi:quinoprotein glucose dehydrogenase